MQLHSDRLEIVTAHNALTPNLFCLKSVPVIAYGIVRFHKPLSTALCDMAAWHRGASSAAFGVFGHTLSGLPVHTVFGS